MQEPVNEQELKDRLSLIENMMAEGRRSTESWGWSFLLWGVAYYIATAWASLGHSKWAWPVTMVGAGLVTVVVGARISQGHPETTLGRAVGSVWQVMGCTLFIVLFALAMSGRSDIHVAMAIIGGMLAVANGTSSLILKWKMQFACALIWLGAGVAGCFGSADQAGGAFLVAVFLCQILFDIYAMALDARRRRRQGEIHA